jgi:hypothetical protein
MSLNGVDFVEFGAEGTIQKVTSFFGAENPAPQNGHRNGHANGTRTNGYAPPPRLTPALGVDMAGVLHLEDAVDARQNHR